MLLQLLFSLVLARRSKLLVNDVTPTEHSWAKINGNKALMFDVESSVSAECKFGEAIKLGNQTTLSADVRRFLKVEDAARCPFHGSHLWYPLTSERKPDCVVLVKNTPDSYCK